MENRLQENFEEIPELPEEFLVLEEEGVPSLEELVEKSMAKIQSAEKASWEVRRKGVERIDRIAESIGLAGKEVEEEKEKINFNEREDAIGNKMRVASMGIAEQVREILKGEKKKQNVDASILEREPINERLQTASIQLKLRNEIERNPQMTAEEMLKFAESHAGKNGFSAVQKNFFGGLIEAYKNKREALVKNREKHKNDKELFKVCFGFEPRHKIEISEGPLSFYIRCSETDFGDARAVGPEKFGQKIDKRMKRMLMQATGDSNPTVLLPELEGQVILANSRAQNLSRTRIHEEQHKYFKLFQQTPSRKSALEKISTVTGEERNNAIREHLRFKREASILEPYVKDEILAYYRAGTNLNSAIEKLVRREENGGLYDYFATLKELFVFELENEGVTKKEAEIAMEEIFIEEYGAILKKSSEVIRNLENAGMEREEIVELLITEPLEQWPNVVRHIKQANKNK